MPSSRLRFLLAFIVSASAVVAAQHSDTPEDIQKGGRLYQASCAACHGPEGDAVPGVALATGRFRHAASDDEVARIIIGGIPGTSMPPNNFTDPEAATIVAYLRSLVSIGTAGTAVGDAARGKAIFEEKGQCFSCHTIGARGSRTGPDLSEVGLLRRVGELERSLLDPDAEILADNRPVRLVTRDGKIIEGRLLNQDMFSLQLVDSNERLISMAKSTLREYALLKKSPMPSYRGKLAPEEIADLVGYLATLTGQHR
jgi:putative heme-binding domain-containing protein